MRCHRRLFNISFKNRITNEDVYRKAQAAIGKFDELLILDKKWKLRWFDYVSSVTNIILHSTVKRKKRRGQKIRLEDNIKEWTRMDFASSARTAENRTKWKGIVAKSSVVPQRPCKVKGYDRIHRRVLFAFKFESYG